MLNRKCPPVKFKKARELRKNLTRAEARLWKYIRRKQLDGYKFRRKAIILGYIVDFYCPRKKLIMEIEENFVGNEAMKKKIAVWNIMEDIIMKKYGLKVLRISNERILDDIDTVLEEITSNLNQ